jgi:cytochrome c-type biogenesis protein CcmH/NrfG
VIDYFQKKFQSAPKDYRYCYWIGRAYQLSIQNSTAQKWLKEGLAIAQQTIETNSNDARALSFVGLFHSRLGNFSDGEIAINRAIQIDSTSPEYLFRCAEIYSIQSDTQKAFSALAHALQWKYDFAELQNPDFSFIAREPEFQPAIIRKFGDQWPLK